MKKDLSLAEIEARFAKIDAQEAEELTDLEKASLAEALAEDSADNVTLEEYKTQKEYSGNLMLRIPRILHKQLAEDAKANGVSLNQYALYKLAK